MLAADPRPRRGPDGPADAGRRRGRRDRRADPPRRPRCKVLVLTTYDTDSDTLPAIEAGATGYLLKDAPRDELFTAVRAAAEGRTVLSPAVASRLVSARRSTAGQRAAVRPGARGARAGRQGHLQP